jgi:hypothetical protein
MFKPAEVRGATIASRARITVGGSPWITISSAKLVEISSWNTKPSVFRAFFQDAKSRRERDIEQQRAQACALKRAPSDIDLFLIAVLSFVEGAVEVHLQALLALITIIQVR